MAQGRRLVAHVAVAAARAGEGGIAALGAGGFLDGFLVVVAQGRRLVAHVAVAAARAGEGGIAALGAGGFLDGFLVVVAQGRLGLVHTAQLFAADRAADDLDPAAGFRAGRRALVLAHRLAGGMPGGGQDLIGLLAAAPAGVGDKAGPGTGGIDDVFLKIVAQGGRHVAGVGIAAVQAGEGGIAVLLAGGLRDDGLIIVTQGVDVGRHPAQLLAAHLAVDHRVISALVLAGRDKAVFCDRLQGGMPGGGDLLIGRIIAARAGLIGVPADLGAGGGLGVMVDIIMAQGRRLIGRIAVAADGAGHGGIAVLGAGGRRDDGLVGMVLHAALLIQGDVGALGVAHEGEGVRRVAQRQRTGDVEAGAVALHAAGIIVGVVALRVAVHGEFRVGIRIFPEGPGEVPPGGVHGARQDQSGIAAAHAAAAQEMAFPVGKVVLPLSVVAGPGICEGPEHGGVHGAGDEAVGDRHGHGTAGDVVVGVGLLGRDVCIGHGVLAVRHDHIGLSDFDLVPLDEDAGGGNGLPAQGLDRLVEGAGGAVDGGLGAGEPGGDGIGEGRLHGRDGLVGVQTRIHSLCRLDGGVQGGEVEGHQRRDGVVQRVGRAVDGLLIVGGVQGGAGVAEGRLHVSDARGGVQSGIHGLGGGDGGLESGIVQRRPLLQGGDGSVQGGCGAVHLLLGLGVEPGGSGIVQGRLHGGDGGGGIQARVHGHRLRDGGVQGGEVQDGLFHQGLDGGVQRVGRGVDLGLGLGLQRGLGVGEGGLHGPDGGGEVQARVLALGLRNGGVQGGEVQRLGGVIAVHVQGDVGARAVVHEGEGVVRVALGQAAGDVKAGFFAPDASGIVVAVGALGVGIHGEFRVRIRVGLEGPGVVAPGAAHVGGQIQAGVVRSHAAAAQILPVAVGEVVLPHAVIGGIRALGSAEGPEHVAVHVAGDHAVLDLDARGAAGLGEAGVVLLGGDGLVGHGVLAVRHDHVGFAGLDAVRFDEGGAQGDGLQLQRGDRAAQGGLGGVDGSLPLRGQRFPGCGKGSPHVRRGGVGVKAQIQGLGFGDGRLQGGIVRRKHHAVASLHIHGGGTNQVRVALLDVDVGVMGEGPHAVHLLDAVVVEGDGLRVHRHGEAGGRAPIGGGTGGGGEVMYVVHAAGVGVGEIDGLVLGIAGIVPGRAAGVGAVQELVARLEDDVAHGILIVVVAPDPDDVQLVAVLVDGVDHQIGVGRDALSPVVGAVAGPVGLQEDDLAAAGPGRQIAVEGGDVLRLKGLVAAAGAGGALGADHVDLHLVVGVGQAAAREAEHGLEGGLLVGPAAEGAGLPVVVAHGVDLHGVGEGGVFGVGDHVVDLGLPVDLAALVVLDVVAAVGQDPGVLALVLQLVHHLDEALVAADAVVQVGEEHGVVVRRLRGGRGQGGQEREQHGGCQEPAQGLPQFAFLFHCCIIFFSV